MIIAAIGLFVAGAATAELVSQIGDTRDSAAAILEQQARGAAALKQAHAHEHRGTPLPRPDRPTPARTSRASPVSAPVSDGPAPGAALPDAAPASPSPDPVDPVAPAPLAGDALVAALNEAEGSELLPAAGHCLHGADLPAAFSGSLAVDLNIDATGLTDASVRDAGTNTIVLPQALLDCLADSVWDVPWPAASDGEHQVTYALQVTTRSGPSPGP